jgi:predicted amidophosphoribosyltransferase
VVGLFILTPIVGFLGFFWWLRRSIVQADCPVCSYPIQGINGNEVQCSNCGELMKIDQGQLVRDTPPDTIDIIAVEVSSD